MSRPGSSFGKNLRCPKRDSIESITVTCLKYSIKRTRERPQPMTAYEGELSSHFFAVTRCDCLNWLHINHYQYYKHIADSYEHSANCFGIGTRDNWSNSSEDNATSNNIVRSKLIQNLITRQQQDGLGSHSLAGINYLCKFFRPFEIVFQYRRD
jgi:heterodisulfide reductase subunit C